MTHMAAVWFATVFLTDGAVLPFGPMPLPQCLAMMHSPWVTIDGRAVPWHVPEDPILGRMIDVPDSEYPEIERIQCIRSAVA